MLIDEIKKANIQAMKDRDSTKRGALSILITKYNNVAIEKKSKGQDATDADLLAIIQKTLKELEDEMTGYKQVGNQARVLDIMLQIKALTDYLPKQLTEDEIRAEIDKLADKSIPSVMKHFKANYAGQVDMSVVSRIVRGAQYVRRN